MNLGPTSGSNLRASQPNFSPEPAEQPTLLVVWFAQKKGRNHSEPTVEKPELTWCAMTSNVLKLCFCLVFSRMRSEGSRFTWGSGGEAVFVKFCVCGRNRPQPLA